MGRKINNGQGCSCIYISQKFYSVPKIIRGQALYILLLRVRGNKDISCIINDCNVGLSVKDFKRIYDDATQDDLNFLKIDCTQRDENKILSRNFCDFYDIKQMIEDNLK
jgi:hypothetical protein